MALAKSERSSSLTGSPARAVWHSKDHANILERYFCGKQTFRGKGCRKCPGTTELVRRTATPILKGEGLRRADTPVGARVAGSRRSKPVLMREPAMWTDTPKMMGVETLLARNRLEPDGTPHSSALDCIL